MKRKESKKKNIGSCQKDEKTVEHEGNSDTNYSWCTWNSPQGLEKQTRGTGNQSKNQDHSDHSSVKICKDILKNAGNLRRLAVIQNLVKDYQLKLI